MKHDFKTPSSTIQVYQSKNEETISATTIPKVNSSTPTSVNKEMLKMLSG